MSDRVSVSIELAASQKAWLDEMIAKYKLEDVSKAMRILVEYGKSEKDKDLIFEEVRCTQC